MSIYLDCNATTPMEPEVLDTIIHYMKDEYGNAGSRTHEFGARAKAAVQLARQSVANVVACLPEEVIFTSGATESNNIAILGLVQYANQTNKNHIISTKIEHKAVLEPLEILKKRGFEITLLDIDSSGRVEPQQLKDALREDTLLVSIMHINNETGIIQPIGEIADLLSSHNAYFHVDAAQSFGKEITALQNSRIDLISVSGHKIYGPKGIGALIAKRRNFNSIPIEPIMFGGGQERGLRPGTLPVQLIAGLGKAAELAIRDYKKRRDRNLQLWLETRKVFEDIGGLLNGDFNHCTSTTINVSLPGLDSEALMLALKNIISISNGSACTSHSYQGSYVLEAMGLNKSRIDSAIRLSWCHMTTEIDWKAVNRLILNLS